MEENKPAVGKSDSNLNAALSYIWILSVIMLVMKKDDEFVKFHAKQGLILFIISFISWILWFIPVIGWLFGLAILVGVVVGFMKAYNGERYKLPVIGDLAEKIHI